MFVDEANSALCEPIRDTEGPFGACLAKLAEFGIAENAGYYYVNCIYDTCEAEGKCPGTEI